VSDRYRVCQLADLAYGSVGIDDLQQPALLQRFPVIQLGRKRLKAASLKPRRVIVDLIDDVIGGFGKRFLGVGRDDHKPSTAGKPEVVGRAVLLPHFGDIAVVDVTVRPRDGKPVAEARGSTQGRRRKAAEPDRRVRLLDGFGRHLDVLKIEEVALEGDGISRKRPANDV
jgi:hypothetical protein